MVLLTVPPVSHLSAVIDCHMPDERCQHLNSFPFGKLEETTGMPSYYVDEDDSASPDIH